MNLEFSRQIFKKIFTRQISRTSVHWEPRFSMRTERHTVMTIWQFCEHALKYWILPQIVYISPRKINKTILKVLFTLLTPNFVQILYEISGTQHADWYIYIYIWYVNDRTAMQCTCVKVLRTVNCAAVDSLQWRGNLMGYWASPCSDTTGWHLQIMDGMLIVMKSSWWDEHKGLHFACQTAVRLSPIWLAC